MKEPWSIKSRARECAISGETFVSGQKIRAAIFPDPDSSGYLRKDFTQEAWKAREEEEAPFSTWLTTYEPPVIEEKAEDVVDQDPETLLQKLVEEDEEHTDGMVATESIKLMEKYAESDDPFFLAVGFFKPHTPYVAPKKYFDMYSLDDIVVPEIPEGYTDTIPAPAAQSVMRLKEQWGLDETVAKEAIRAYYATTTFLDAQIGRLLEGLKELGLKEDTIVLFSSDHGYHLGENGYYQKRTMFERSSRVPLILSVPWLKGQVAETDSIVEMIDFYKTLSDLAGLTPVPTYVKGKVFTPLLSNKDEEVRTEALMRHEHGYTMRTSRYRYNLWDTGDIELYDHSNDPGEMKNLARNPEYSQLIGELDERIRIRMEDARSDHPQLKFTRPKPGDRGLDLKDTYIK